MRFTLNDIELNLTSGIVTKQGEITNIRAKTLQVLNYLISHKDNVVTKQELLTAIWQDVIVQEQVLVQSIKEIRRILGSDVIKTYPRQGYQWTADLSECEKITHKTSKKHLQMMVVVATLLLTVSIFFYQSFNTESQLNSQLTPFNIAFLPIINDMPDDIHDWVPLEGMDYLSQSLKHQKKLAVIENKSLLTRLKKFGSNRNKTTINYHATLSEIADIQTEFSADLVVQAKLLGYPQDFLLQYTLHLKHNVERGVLFSDNVKNAFDQLSTLLKKRYGKINSNETKTVSSNFSYKNDFSNEAYTRGIAFYHQREYSKAISFFTSALEDNPELLAARRNLAASYVNSGNSEKGISLMLENIEQAKTKSKHREEIRSNLMLGVLLINLHDISTESSTNLMQAELYVKQAKVLAMTYQDNLFIAYAHEELGKIKRLKGDYTQAIMLQKEALKYHEGFRGKYGQTSALIELARIAASQKNVKQAETYLIQAKNIALENGVATNQVFVLLAEADIYHLQGLAIKANNMAQQAMNVAKLENSNYLIARVTAWLNNNTHYEIN